MLQTTYDALRALLPHASEEEIEAAGERLRRYVELAAVIAESLSENSGTGLTPSESRGSVMPGLVDPGTFTTTTTTG